MILPRWSSYLLPFTPAAIGSHRHCVGLGGRLSSCDYPALPESVSHHQHENRRVFSRRTACTRWLARNGSRSIGFEAGFARLASFVATRVPGSCSRSAHLHSYRDVLSSGARAEFHET